MTPIDDEETVLGKTVSDLQDNVVVESNFNIHGDLNYVTGYTGYSGVVSEQSGYYLALHFESNASSITVENVGGNHPGRVVTLDSDGDLVLRITDKDHQKIIVTAGTEVNTYSFGGLNCIPD